MRCIVGCRGNIGAGDGGQVISKTYGLPAGIGRHPIWRKMYSALLGSSRVDHYAAPS